MKNNDARTLDIITEKTNKLNRLLGFKRFYLIKSSGDDGFVFGLYDTVSKKFTLSSKYTDNKVIFSEMEDLLNNVNINNIKEERKKRHMIK